jgi:para-aminobenzoate synthetase / 4-amino-4-deoxychorismate lyase
VSHAARASLAETRPDPAHGVFETLLVVDGVPLELDAHLERLEGSLRDLYGAAVPEDTRRIVLHCVEGAALARFRVTLVPDFAGGFVTSTSLQLLAKTIVLPGWDGAVDLGALVVAGGLGPHKWADRRLVEGAEAGLEGRVPLILDTDGSVLEASRGNVFVVSDGAVVTPPADGRILPGVTRARVLVIAAGLGVPIREARVSVTELTGADEVFLTGAVRGAEPVRSFEGVSWQQGELTGELAEHLRRHWDDDR